MGKKLTIEEELKRQADHRNFRIYTEVRFVRDSRQQPCIAINSMWRRTAAAEGYLDRVQPKRTRFHYFTVTQKGLDFIQEYENAEKAPV